MTDPMDIPPTDHGSDRYGYVETQGAPAEVQPAEEYVDRLLATACLDCNPNLFLRWTGDDEQPWHVTVAHDNTCPSVPPP